MVRRLILVLLLAPFLAVSQQYNFISYTVAEGLAQNQVYSIVQDNEGYLWFATTGGLSRFDGREFVNYSQREGLFRNHVDYLFKDDQGRIWMAMKGGVSLYDGEGFKSFPFKPELSTRKVTSIEQDHEGRMWFGTKGGGLVVMHPDGKLEYLNTDQNLSHNDVRTLYTDRQGLVWIGTRGGVNVVQDSGIFVLPEESFNGLSVSHITGDKDDNLWISTFANGVFRVTGEGVDHITGEDGLITNGAREAHIARDGHVWLACLDGISELDGQAVARTYGLGDGLPFVDLKCAYQDNEGNMWFGTNGQGVIKFSGRAFINYTRSDGLEDDRVMTMTEDDSGRIWFGTYAAGPIIFNGKGFRSLENDLPQFGTVWSSLTDRNGTIWLGTTHMGLLRYDRETRDLVSYGARDTLGALSDPKVTAIYESANGTIWVGTRSGIARFVDGQFRNYGVERGFEGTNVRVIEEDEAGNLWCGAENGLYIFNPISEHTEERTISNTIEETKVFCIERDHNGKFWLGTDNGLFHQEGDGFKYLPLGEDTRTNFINFLLADEDALWVGTNYGIYQLFEVPERSDLVIRSFTNHEGIRNLECNLNAAFRDSKGYYWFGTAGGVVRLDKSMLPKVAEMNAQVTIRSLALFFEETDWKPFGALDERTGLPKNLVLSHSKNTLTFDFILFNYTNPEGVLYKYMLEGYDEDWSPPGSDATATYRKLPPGDYAFKVMARASNGLWTAPTVFRFTINPPFWSTWWFFALCLIGVACLAGAMLIWRRAVSKRKRETEELKFRNKLLALEHQSLNASLNRHFIFNALNSIQYYINRQDRISANKYLSSFAKLIRKNLDSSSSGNNYVTLAEEMERIDLYLSLEHMRFRNKFEYEILYESEVDMEAVMVPAMLLQPFIENSIWHGILPMEEPGKITIRLGRATNGDIRFEIEDNGIGIDQSLRRKAESGQGHDSKGMKITSGRIDLLKTITRKNISLKGPFQLHDNEGNSIGTKVEITIPVNTMETFF